MPQLIEVPGEGVVEFPDGMSDEDIAGAIRQNFAPAEPVVQAAPEVPEDAPFGQPLRRLGSGIAESAAIGAQGLSRMIDPWALFGPAGRLIGELSGAAQVTREGTEAARGFARDVQERAAEDYGVDPSQDQAFSSKLIKGAASIVPVLASGGTLAPLTGAAIAGESARQDAEATGGTEFEKDTAFWGNAIVGAIGEKILGVPKWLKMAREAKIPDGTLKEIVKAGTMNAVKAAPMEASQEAIQTLAENWIARDIAQYDPQRELGQGVGEAAAIGVVVGGGVGGVTGTAGAIDSSRRIPTEAELEGNPDAGTVNIDGKPHAVQDDILKPVEAESTKGKAIRSLVGDEALATEATTETATETVAPSATPTQSAAEPEAIQESETVETSETVTEPQPETQDAIQEEAAAPQADQEATEAVTETPPSAPQPPADATGDQSPTGIRNAIVDQERVKRGLPPRMAPLKRTFGMLWDRAMQVADQDAQAGSRLVQELQDNPRPLEDWESALLAHEQVVRQNAFDKAVEAQNAAPADETAAATLARARDDVQAIYDAGQAAGTKSGQSLAARKLLVNEDFTLAKMEATTRAIVNQGKPLSQQQASEVKALHDKIAATEKKLAELEARESEREAKDLFDQLLKIQKRAATASAKRGKGITDFLDDQAQKAKARIIARRGRLNVSVDPLNIAGLVDEAIIGASYIAKGVNSIADWSARMVKDFGERIQPYLNDLFARSQDFYRTNAALFTAPEEGAEAGPVDKTQLTQKTVFDLARAHVQAGTEGMEQVMDAVHQDLLADHPDLTIRDVRDLFSGYGKVAFPSKAEDLVKLREYRRLAQLVSAIEDAQRKVAPKKSGPQRDEPTQAIRDKMKELQKAMREAGIETQSPERQLKSANAARITALKNQIEDLDRQLRTGDKPAKGKPVPPTPEVERLRAERDAMREKLLEIEAEEEPGRSPEEIQLQRDKTAIRNRIKKLESKIAAGDYSKPAKRQPVMDAEKERLLFENRKVKEQYARGLWEAQQKQKTPFEKAVDYAMQALGLLRSLKLSLDLGAFRRQGGFLVAGRPGMGIRGLGAALKALKSEQGRFQVMEEIRNRDNYKNGLYQQSKLFIVDETEVKLSRLEEMYMNRWARNVPGLAASERGHVTFLNRLRADAFDAMVANLTSTGKATPEESRQIADFVNIATGRGSLGRFSTSLPAANLFFLAPSYYVSRVQLLTGTPIWKSKGRVRTMIAKEYARSLSGLAVYYGLLMGAVGLFWPEDEVSVELDPRSTDFGKVRFGTTRIDPLMGLAQFTTFLARLITRETKTQKGVASLTEPKYGRDDIGDVIGKFARSKASPNLGLAYDILKGRHFDRTKVTPLTTAEQILSLSIKDAYEIMTKHGIPKGTALTMLALLGDSVQVYEDHPGPLHELFGVEMPTKK